MISCIHSGCFWFLTKIRKRSWTNFWCTFSAWFFHKNVHYLILVQLTKLQCHTNLFPFKMPNMSYELIIKTIDEFINFNIYFRSASKAMTNREGGNTKTWISWERKKLFRWNKNYFSWLFRDYHLVKKWKTADAIFNLAFCKFLS